MCRALGGLRLSARQLEEQCALMVLPCWNGISVYSDPIEHYRNSETSELSKLGTFRRFLQKLHPSRKGLPQFRVQNSDRKLEASSDLQVVLNRVRLVAY